MWYNGVGGRTLDNTLCFKSEEPPLNWWLFGGTM